MAKVILERQGIYCVRNLISGRVYVGSARRIDLRWHSHLAALRAGNHGSIRFQRSWDKHGPHAFEWTILELVPDQADLIVREQYWIDALNAADPKVGLNMAPKAGSVLGLKMSAESRARMSVAQRGKTISPEGRANMAAAARRVRSPEELENMAAAQRGKKYSAETRAKQSAQRKGVPKSETHRAAIGNAHRGRTLPDDQRAKLSASVSAHFAARASSVPVRAMGAPRPEQRRLTFEQAEEIRALRAAGATYAELVDRFDCKKPMLCAIIKRRTYRAP